jgi:Tol biopolymer transport system component
VNACLEKDPLRRPANLLDLARELEALPDRGLQEQGVSAGHSLRISRRSWLLGAAGTAALLVAGWRARQFLAAPVVVSNALISPPDGFVWAGGMAISPDGRHLAAAVLNRARVLQLWVRALNSSTERFLPGTEGASFPFWSPDSKQIGFFAHGKLHAIFLSSGSPRAVAPAGSAAGSWGAGGNIVFGPGTLGGLALVPAGGTSPRRLAFDDTGISEYFAPQFLPDGRRFLFVGWDRQSGAVGVYLADPALPGVRLLMNGATAGQFASPDYLLFLRGGALMAQKFDWTRGRPAEEPVIVAARGNSLPAEKAGPPITAFSVSQNGVLAYRTEAPMSRDRLVWHDRDGRFRRTAGEPGKYMELFLSPDGKFAAVNLGAARGNLGLLDLATNKLSQITDHQPIVYDAVWSPDSRKLVYQIYAPPKTRVMELTLGQSSPRPLLDDGAMSFPDAWSPDGKWILIRKSAGHDLMVLLLAAGRPSEQRMLLKTRYQTDQFQFSPDGRWLAYNSTESGRWEVYVARFPGMKEVTRVSYGGGCQPIWRGDGKELFYLTLDGKLMSVEIHDGTTAHAKQLFASRIHVYAGFAQYAADAAGQQFLMIEPDPAAAPQGLSDPIHIMANWGAKLRD